MNPLGAHSSLLHVWRRGARCWLRLRPDQRNAHLNRAAALLLLGRYAEARQAIAVAQTHGASPPAAMLRLLETATRTPTGE